LIKILKNAGIYGSWEQKSFNFPVRLFVGGEGGRGGRFPLRSGGRGGMSLWKRSIHQEADGCRPEPLPLLF